VFFYCLCGLERIILSAKTILTLHGLSPLISSPCFFCSGNGAGYDIISLLIQYCCYYYWFFGSGYRRKWTTRWSRSFVCYCSEVMRNTKNSGSCLKSIWKHMFCEELVDD